MASRTGNVESVVMDKRLDTLIDIFNADAYAWYCGMYAFVALPSVSSHEKPRFYMLENGDERFSFDFDGTIKSFVAESKDFLASAIANDEDFDDDSYYQVLGDISKAAEKIDKRDLHFGKMIFRFGNTTYLNNVEMTCNSYISRFARHMRKNGMFAGCLFSPEYNNADAEAFCIERLHQNEVMVLGFFRDVHEVVHELEKHNNDLFYVTTREKPYNSLENDSYISAVSMDYEDNAKLVKDLEKLFVEQYKVGFRDILSDNYGERFVENGLYFSKKFSHHFKATMYRKDDMDVVLFSGQVPGVLHVAKNFALSSSVPDFDDCLQDTVRIDGTKVAKLLGCRSNVVEQGVVGARTSDFVLTDSAVRDVYLRTSDGRACYSQVFYAALEHIIDDVGMIPELKQAFEDNGLNIDSVGISSTYYVGGGKGTNILARAYNYPDDSFPCLSDAVLQTYHFFKATDFDKRAEDCYKSLTNHHYDVYDNIKLVDHKTSDSHYLEALDKEDVVDIYHGISNEAKLFVADLDDVFKVYKKRYELLHSQSLDAVEFLDAVRSSEHVHSR